MRIFYQSRLGIIGALAFAGAAYAQQPPDSVNSDFLGNTAMGQDALMNEVADAGPNTFNTASGAFALRNNTTGYYNTASGGDALYVNSTGSYNTASGSQALYSNTTGYYNTASGGQALFLNTTGGDNTALGANALYSNTTGVQNTASGDSALVSNTTGSSNIAEGYQAGMNLTTGSSNIDIGNVGVAGESNLIRIGTKGTHKGAIIAGIRTSIVTGNVSAVYVTTSGRLGVLASSERYKTAITPIGDTEKLQKLRPVSFHLKADPTGAVQYGLIAEEVAKVYPELVIRDDKGRIDGVRYDELAPMLLNELQRQRTQMTEKIAAQDAQIAAQGTHLQDVERQLAIMQTAFAKLHTEEGLVAKR